MLSIGNRGAVPALLPSLASLLPFGLPLVAGLIADLLRDAHLSQGPGADPPPFPPAQRCSAVPLCRHHHLTVSLLLSSADVTFLHLYSSCTPPGYFPCATLFYKASQSSGRDSSRRQSWLRATWLRHSPPRDIKAGGPPAPPHMPVAFFKQFTAPRGLEHRKRRYCWVLCATCALLTLLLSLGPPGTSMSAIVLKNRAGVEAHVLRRGAIIQKLLVPNSSGALADVVLGFDEEQPYKVRRVCWQRLQKRRGAVGRKRHRQWPSCFLLLPGPAFALCLSMPLLACSHLLPAVITALSVSGHFSGHRRTAPLPTWAPWWGGLPTASRGQSSRWMAIPTS